MPEDLAGLDAWLLVDVDDPGLDLGDWDASDDDDAEFEAIRVPAG